jgi:hypothetical protein
VDLEAAQETAERLSAAHQHLRQVRVTEVEVTAEVHRLPLAAAVEPEQVRSVEAARGLFLALAGLARHRQLPAERPLQGAAAAAVLGLCKVRLLDLADLAGAGMEVH